MLGAFAFRGLWPKDRASRGLARGQQSASFDGLSVESCADVLAPPSEQRQLLSEAQHAGMEDEDGERRERLMTDERLTGGVSICLFPGCGKRTWNGQPGEYCSVNCRDSAPPICKNPECCNPAYNSEQHEFCSMHCKISSTICLRPGCNKPTWNGRAKGFCSLACFQDTEPVCMMQGCSKKTFNGRPAGFCTPECRDKAKYMKAKRTLRKDGSRMRELDSHIARAVSTKLTMLSKAEQESEAAKMETTKARLMEATSSADLLLRAEVLVHQNWLGKYEALPGNIYRIGAFGRLADYRKDSAHRTWGRVFGWICIWVLQVVGPPAIWLSTIFAWGVQDDMAFHWRDWEVDFYDWRHIALTKALALILQICFVLNGLYVVMGERDDWLRIHTLIRYFKHHNINMEFKWRVFLYLGAYTNCWVVLWCCADTVVVLGSSQSPKDVLFDALTLLFLYNLDDIGGELDFVAESDWPGARLGWIYAEMVAEDWHLEEAGSPTSKEEEFDDEQLGTGGVLVYWSFQATIWILGVALVVYPVFNTISPFLKIAPPDGGWP